MRLKRTNYGASRVVLSIFEFIAWIILCVGIIVVSSLIGVATRNFGGSGLMVLVPGVVFCIVSVLIITVIQMARSSVDTADYTYQMLSVARENLDVSKRALKKQATALSFADRPPVAISENPARAEAPGTASYAAPPASSEPKDTALDWDYRDTRIHRTQEGYLVEGQVFETLELAKNFVDGEALRASLTSPT